MNKHELLGKIIMKYYYVREMLELETMSNYDFVIFLDIVDSECDKRDFK